MVQEEGHCLDSARSGSFSVLQDGLHALPLAKTVIAKFLPSVLGGCSHSCQHSGLKAAGFGGVALFTVIYYASGIPKVQHDILQVCMTFPCGVTMTKLCDATPTNNFTEGSLHWQLLCQ